MTAKSREPSFWTNDVDPHVEFLKCSADCAYFTSTYGVIDDAQNLGETGTGTRRFRLWPAQTKVVWDLMSIRFVVILKARQLGISWTVCAYVLWRVLFQGNQTILLISKGQAEADELLRRIKALYERLPKALRALLPTLDKDSTRKFVLSNGSHIESLPATSTAAQGRTASVLVIDEAAFINRADKLIANAKPTIDQGGQMIVLSTANGVGGAFHTIWTKAEAGQNGYHHIFLPWWSRPDRTVEDIERFRAQSNDPEREIPEQYPCNALEAFVSSGRARFPIKWINAQGSNIAHALDAFHFPESLQGVPGLRLYRGPYEGEKFVISADVAEGIDVGGEGDDRADYSAAHVISAATKEQVAVLHGRWEPDIYADYLLMLASAYGNPEILVERNNHGHAVLAVLKKARYRKIGRGHDGKPGWLTNEVTREQSIDYLAAHLRDGAVVIRDKPTLNEMLTFHVNHRGYSCAIQGKHDDLVMALVIFFGWSNHGLLRKIGAGASYGDNPIYGYRG